MHEYVQDPFTTQQYPFPVEANLYIYTQFFFITDVYATA